MLAIIVSQLLQVTIKYIYNMSWPILYILQVDRITVSEVVLSDSTTIEMANSMLSIPMAMNINGDLASNWKYSTSRASDKKFLSGLAQKEVNVRLTMLKIAMGKNCYEILQRLPTPKIKQQWNAVFYTTGLTQREVWHPKDLSLITTTKTLRDHKQICY